MKTSQPRIITNHHEESIFFLFVSIGVRSWLNGMTPYENQLQLAS